MKKLRFTQLKRIVIAIPIALLLVVYCNVSYGQVPVVITQSNCFTISIASTTNGCSIDGTCNEPGQYCEVCAVVTITHNKCAGLTLKNLSVSSTSSVDCHSVCGAPNGDFTVDFEGCSWVDPRNLTHINAGGITYMGTAKFTICRVPGATRTYNISLPAGTMCGGNPCTPAQVQF